MLGNLERGRTAAAEGMDSDEACHLSACPISEVAQLTATAAVPLLILHVAPPSASVSGLRENARRVFSIFEPPIARKKQDVVIDRCSIRRTFALISSILSSVVR